MHYSHNRNMKREETPHFIDPIKNKKLQHYYLFFGNQPEILLPLFVIGPITHYTYTTQDSQNGSSLRCQSCLRFTSIKDPIKKLKEEHSSCFSSSFLYVMMSDVWCIQCTAYCIVNNLENNVILKLWLWVCLAPDLLHVQ